MSSAHRAARALAGVGAFALALASSAGGGAARGRAQDDALIVTLRIGVVQSQGQGQGAPAVDDAWIDARVAEANRVFAPTALSFRRGPTFSLPPAHARIEDRSDRNALGQYVAPEVLNLFVVGTLMDVDEPGRERRGVHWRDRAAGTHYVIVSAIAEWPAIFAHELGHFFGEPHSTTPNDVMSYSQDGTTPPFFDPAQVRRVRRRARAMAASGELRLGTAAPDQ